VLSDERAKGSETSGLHRLHFDRDFTKAVGARRFGNGVAV
jgi:hypothetical protein